MEQREEGITEEICAMQTKVALMGVSADELKNIIIAYEPVWAIGTGKTATADQANEVNGFIRSVVAKLYGEKEEAHNPVRRFHERRQRRGASLQRAR